VFEPLEGAAIAIRIRNFAAPERPGTDIRPGPAHGDPSAICATANTEVAVIRVLGPGVGVRPGLIGLVGSRLARAGVNILTVLTAQTAINLLVDRDDAEKSRLALMGAGEDAIRSVEVVDDAAIVAVVGSAFDRTPGVAGRFFAALERAGINAFIVAGGASESAVYGVVKRGAARSAVRALHGEFFPGPSPRAGLVSPAQNP
jgi:aspartate kinase/aspartokinase/homoserine dehydrogenase 1